MTCSTRGRGILSWAFLSAIVGVEQKITWPLPKESSKIIAENAFPISPRRARLSWLVFIAMSYIYGVFMFCKYFLLSLKSVVLKSKTDLGDYVYFIRLSKNNFQVEVKMKKLQYK
jgi:polysaccharide biosynthesis PFTS motif protein